MVCGIFRSFTWKTQFIEDSTHLQKWLKSKKKNTWKQLKNQNAIAFLVSVLIQFNFSETCLKNNLIKWVDCYVYTFENETLWYHRCRYVLYTEHGNEFQWNFVYCFTPLKWTASKGLHEWRAIVKCKILERQWFTWSGKKLVDFLRENICTILYEFHCEFLKIARPFKFLNKLLIYAWKTIPKLTWHFL